MNEIKHKNEYPRLMIFPCYSKQWCNTWGIKSFWFSFILLLVLYIHSVPMYRRRKRKYHELGVIGFFSSSSGTFILVTITGKNTKHAKNSLTLIACLPEEQHKRQLCLNKLLHLCVFFRHCKTEEGKETNQGNYYELPFQCFVWFFSLLRRIILIGNFEFECKSFISFDFVVWCKMNGK